MNKIPRNKLKSFLYVTCGGCCAYAAINIYKLEEKFYKNYVIPVIHLIDPENAHNIAVQALKHRLIPKSSYKDPEQLKITVFGREFSNPIGIAAGFDKDGKAVLGLKDIGFGFVEIGSVTPEPQPGNEKPRIFRLSNDSAVINRYGFNSEGHDVVLNRLETLRQRNDDTGVIGVNLGKNKLSTDPIEDYVKGVQKFGLLADYLVINISSPNTPGLRSLQHKQDLKRLLTILIEVRNKLQVERKPPLLLKLAPDLSYEEKKDIAEVIMQKDCKIDGLIVSNTTIERPISLISKEKSQTGGLSGPPLKDVSTKMIEDMSKLTKGLVPIIGVGGISNGQDAYDKIKAGAVLVQIYTSMIYEGPPVVTKIKKELLELLLNDGYKNVSEAVGTAK